jgi:hypothetical protein
VPVALAIMELARKDDIELLSGFRYPHAGDHVDAMLLMAHEDPLDAGAVLPPAAPAGELAPKGIAGALAMKRFQAMVCSSAATPAMRWCGRGASARARAALRMALVSSRLRQRAFST